MTGSKKNNNQDDYSDSDSDQDEPESKTNDFPSMFRDLFSNVSWKLALIQFILFIVLMSSQFSERVLSRMNSAWVDGATPTNTGTMVLGLLLTTCLILFDLLIKGEFI
jgi:hypothetical protein